MQSIPGKKLILRKETVRNLQDQELVDIGGGSTPATVTVTASVASAAASVTVLSYYGTRRLSWWRCKPAPQSQQICATNISANSNQAPQQSCSCDGCGQPQAAAISGDSAYFV